MNFRGDSHPDMCDEMLRLRHWNSKENQNHGSDPYTKTAKCIYVSSVLLLKINCLSGVYIYTLAEIP
jgi:hypothetical protein